MKEGGGEKFGVDMKMFHYIRVWNSEKNNKEIKVKIEQMQNIYCSCL